MSEEELEKLVNNKAQTEYMRAKAEAETREMSAIVQDTSKTLQVKLNERASSIINTSPEVDKKINSTTDVLVDMGLETQKNQVEAELKKSQRNNAKADFELNEDDYRAFGQEIAPNKKWKRKMIELGNDFWFIVLYAICFFSLAPFYSYVKVIKSQSKALKFVAICVGVILLLTCLGGLTYALLRKCGVW